MKRFNKNVKVGTRVKIRGINELCTVSSVHDTKKWITVKEHVGSFQRYHVENYTNKTINYSEVENEKIN